MQQAQIFIGKDQFFREQPLYEYIMQLLMKEKIRGATVFIGRLGYDESKHINRPYDLFSFDETPVMITFIDEEENVKSALTALRKEVKSGFIITNHVDKWN